MDKVAIYCRLSNEDEDKEDNRDESESIQNQKNLLMRYAIDKGWDIYKIYSDDDYSGLDKDRPDFNVLLKDAENKRFNIVLCKHQSRFTRDMELVEGILHNKFVEWGIRFVTVVDGVDTSDKHSKKSRQINGLVNEWYCEDVSESIKAVFKNKRESGKFIGSFATYGYLKDPNDRNRLIIDEEASKVIKQIFDWYIEGNGCQNIAHKLNEAKILNPTMYKKSIGLNYINPAKVDNYGLWNKTTVKRILKNETYIGNMVQHKGEKVNYKTKKITMLKEKDWVVVKDTHEPIIDKDTFNIVQKRLNSNTRSTGLGKVHIFAGKVKCLDCGSIMSKDTSDGVSYLRCKLHSLDKNLCSNHTIRLDELTKVVTERLHGYLDLINDEDKLSLNLTKDNSIDNKLKTLKKDYKKIFTEVDNRDTALRNIYMDKVRGIISEEQFKEFNSVFTKEKEEMLVKQKEIESKIDELNNRKDDNDRYIRMIQKYKNFNELTYIMVNEFIDYIEIGEKNKTHERKIKIHWNI